MQLRLKILGEAPRSEDPLGGGDDGSAVSSSTLGAILSGMSEGRPSILHAKLPVNLPTP